MKTRERRRGVTLTEMMIAMALTGVIAVAFAGFLKYVLRATTTENDLAQGAEAARQALEGVELALVHANQVTVASPSFVEFIADADQSPKWDRNAADCAGTPLARSADADCDAATIASPGDSWRSGFDLTDDDDDGDGNVDVRERVYLSSGAVYRDMSVNGEPWGKRATRLAVGVSTFTLTYWGNPSTPGLGAGLDADGNGLVDAREMDCAPGGAGDCDGSLDLQSERDFITTVRVTLGVDVNRDGKQEYKIETDVYPPLLPLKPAQ